MRIVALLLLLLTADWARGEAPVSVRLVAAVKAVAPGQSFQVGALFTIAPGWHIYWRHSGDAGEPTTVKVEGAGETLYPIPRVFMEEGNIRTFGYANKVMLSSQVRAPATLKAGEKLKVTAQVDWLQCKSTCEPGEAKLELSLPVAEDAAPDNAALFEKWRGRLPADATERAAIERAPDGQITLDWREPVGEVLAFARDEGAKVEVTREGERRTLLRVREKAKGTGPSMVLDVLYRTPGGEWLGVVVPVDVSTN